MPQRDVQQLNAPNSQQNVQQEQPAVRKVSSHRGPNRRAGHQYAEAAVILCDVRECALRIL